MSFRYLCKVPDDINLNDVPELSKLFHGLTIDTVSRCTCKHSSCPNTIVKIKCKDIKISPLVFGQFVATTGTVASQGEIHLFQDTSGLCLQRFTYDNLVMELLPSNNILIQCEFQLNVGNILPKNSLGANQGMACLINLNTDETKFFSFVQTNELCDFGRDLQILLKQLQVELVFQSLIVEVETLEDCRCVVIGTNNSSLQDYVHAPQVVFRLAFQEKKISNVTIQLQSGWEQLKKIYPQKLSLLRNLIPSIEQVALTLDFTYRNKHWSGCISLNANCPLRLSSAVMQFNFDVQNIQLHMSLNATRTVDIDMKLGVRFEDRTFTLGIGNNSRTALTILQMEPPVTSLSKLAYMFRSQPLFNQVLKFKEYDVNGKMFTLKNVQFGIDFEASAVKLLTLGIKTSNALIEWKNPEGFFKIELKNASPSHFMLPNTLFGNIEQLCFIRSMNVTKFRILTHLGSLDSCRSLLDKHNTHACENIPFPNTTTCMALVRNFKLNFETLTNGRKGLDEMLKRCELGQLCLSAFWIKDFGFYGESKIAKGMFRLLACGNTFGIGVECSDVELLKCSNLICIQLDQFSLNWFSNNVMAITGKLDFNLFGFKFNIKSTVSIKDEEISINVHRKGGEPFVGLLHIVETTGTISWKQRQDLQLEVAYAIITEEVSIGNVLHLGALKFGLRATITGAEDIVALKCGTAVPCKPFSKGCLKGIGGFAELMLRNLAIELQLSKLGLVGTFAIEIEYPPFDGRHGCNKGAIVEAVVGYGKVKKFKLKITNEFSMRETIFILFPGIKANRWRPIDDIAKVRDFRLEFALGQGVVDFELECASFVLCKYLLGENLKASLQEQTLQGKIKLNLFSGFVKMRASLFIRAKLELAVDISGEIIVGKLFKLNTSANLDLEKRCFKFNAAVDFLTIINVRASFTQDTKGTVIEVACASTVHDKFKSLINGIKSDTVRRLLDLLSTLIPSVHNMYFKGEADTSLCIKSRGHLIFSILGYKFSLEFAASFSLEQMKRWLELQLKKLLKTLLLKLVPAVVQKFGKKLGKALAKLFNIKSKGTNGLNLSDTNLQGSKDIDIEASQAMNDAVGSLGSTSGKLRKLLDDALELSEDEFITRFNKIYLSIASTCCKCSEEGFCVHNGETYCYDHAVRGNSKKSTNFRFQCPGVLECGHPCPKFHKRIKGKTCTGECSVPVICCPCGKETTTCHLRRTKRIQYRPCHGTCNKKLKLCIDSRETKRCTKPCHEGPCLGICGAKHTRTEGWSCYCGSVTKSILQCDLATYCNVSNGYFNCGSSSSQNAEGALFCSKKITMTSNILPKQTNLDKKPVIVTSPEPVVTKLPKSIPTPVQPEHNKPVFRCLHGKKKDECTDTYVCYCNQTNKCPGGHLAYCGNLLCPNFHHNRKAKPLCGRRECNCHDENRGSFISENAISDIRKSDQFTEKNGSDEAFGHNSLQSFKDFEAQVKAKTEQYEEAFKFCWEHLNRGRNAGKYHIKRQKVRQIDKLPLNEISHLDPNDPLEPHTLVKFVQQQVYAPKLHRGTDIKDQITLVVLESFLKREKLRFVALLRCFSNECSKLKGHPKLFLQIKKLDGGAKTIQIHSECWETHVKSIFNSEYRGWKDTTRQKSKQTFGVLCFDNDSFGNTFDKQITLGISFTEINRVHPTVYEALPKKLIHHIRPSDDDLESSARPKPITLGNPEGVAIGVVRLDCLSYINVQFQGETDKIIIEDEKGNMSFFGGKTGGSTHEPRVSMMGLAGVSFHLKECCDKGCSEISMQNVEFHFNNKKSALFSRCTPKPPKYTVQRRENIDTHMLILYHTHKQRGRANRIIFVNSEELEQMQSSKNCINEFKKLYDAKVCQEK